MWKNNKDKMRLIKSKYQKPIWDSKADTKGYVE
jgi:hypothetical protein